MDGSDRRIDATRGTDGPSGRWSGKKARKQLLDIRFLDQAIPLLQQLHDTLVQEYARTRALAFNWRRDATTRSACSSWRNRRSAPKKRRYVPIL